MGGPRGGGGGRPGKVLKGGEVAARGVVSRGELCPGRRIPGDGRGYPECGYPGMTFGGPLPGGSLAGVAGPGGTYSYPRGGGGPPSGHPGKGQGRVGGRIGGGRGREILRVPERGGRFRVVALISSPHPAANVPGNVAKHGRR